MLMGDKPEADLKAPDFIIGGAAKCGTNSLHGLLNAHPQIRMARGEIHYLDADDPLNHPDFFHGGLRWPHVDLVAGDAAAQWYRSRFPERQDGEVLIGEDSTTYLHSALVAKRLRNHRPGTKLIFALRDPVARAISQYWHLVWNGSATVGIEAAITRHPIIVRWSAYEESLRVFFAHLPRSVVHFFIFERFVENPQAEINSLLEFLGCEPISLSGQETHRNKSLYPIHLQGYLWFNMLLQAIPDRRYAHYLGDHPPARTRAAERLRRAVRTRGDRLLLRRTKAPPINEEVRRFLHGHLRERNSDLSTLCDIDLAQYWPTLR
jgi:Sulfotransferase family